MYVLQIERTTFVTLMFFLQRAKRATLTLFHLVSNSSCKSIAMNKKAHNPSGEELVGVQPLDDMSTQTSHLASFMVAWPQISSPPRNFPSSYGHRTHMLKLKMTYPTTICVDACWRVVVFLYMWNASNLVNNTSSTSTFTSQGEWTIVARPLTMPWRSNTSNHMAPIQWGDTSSL